MATPTDVVISEIEDINNVVCDDNDWNCLLENFYKGYLLYVEAVKVSTDEESGEVNVDVNRVEATGLSNDEINEIISNMKVLYPDYKIRIHFCGNHVGRPCKIIDV